MSYTKLTQQMPNIDVGLAALMAREHMGNEAMREALLDTGVTVQLDDGSMVWVSCVMWDDPATHPVEFFAVGIAGDVDGPFMSHGSPVAEVFPRTYIRAVAEQQGVDAIRKAMMLVMLGEDPEVDWMGLTPLERAERSVRTKLKLRDQQATQGRSDVL